MKVYRVVVTELADSDLTQIVDYIAQQSSENALRVMERITTEMASLSSFPLRYPLVKTSHRIRFEVRSMPVMSWMIRYRVIEDQAVVRILSVRHGARADAGLSSYET